MEKGGGLDYSADYREKSELSTIIKTLDALPIAGCVAINDQDMMIVHANSDFYKLLGYSLQEVQYKFGMRLSAVLSDATQFAQLTANKTLAGEHKYLHSSGQQYWIRSYAQLLDIDGARYVLLFFGDITLQKKYELETLKLTDGAYQISGMANLEIFLYNMKTCFAEKYSAGPLLEQVSTLSQERSGSFANAVLERQILDPVDEASFCAAFSNISKGIPVDIELRLRSAGDQKRWIRLCLSVLQTKDAPQMAIGFLQDITDQKQTLLRYLNETQCAQAMLSDKISYAQVNISEDKWLFSGGLWKIYNEIRDKITYSELTVSFINKVVHPDDRKHYLELVKKENLINALDNGINRLGCQFRRIVEQNQMVWMEITIFLYRNASDKSVQSLLYLENIDKIKRLEFRAAHNTSAEMAQISHSDAQISVSSENMAFDHFMSEQGEITYLVNPDTYELILGNDALYNRVGMTREQCAGKTCYEVMQQRETPCPFCCKANWNTDKFCVWRNQNLVLEQEFLIKNKLVNWQGKQVMLAIAVDISNNKSVQDSLDNSAVESHMVVSGIQRMIEAPDLHVAMQNAQEAIAYFFGADAVQIWQQREKDANFSRTYEWTRQPDTLEDAAAPEILQVVNAWLKSKAWNQSIIIESQESMLMHSYDMFELMKRSKLHNQLWIPLRDSESLLGVLVIANVTANFQNTTFMESFGVLMLGELRRRALIESTLYASEHDELTGVLNRSSFDRFLVQFNGDLVHSLGVVVSDINDMKGINKRRGVHVGDQYICAFAAYIKSVFPADKIFRMNGDEFLIAVTNMEESELRSRVQVLDSLLQEETRFSVAFGSVWDNVEKSLDELISQATASVKLEKRRYYDLLLDARDQDRHDMLRELIEQIELRRFEIFLQPKIDLHSGKLIGAEALIRYRHPKHGIIPPGQFIDLLEKNNFIRYIDLFVLEEVCRITTNWISQGIECPVISFNYSRLTLLERNILSSTQAICNKYGAPHDKLEVEITESVAEMGKSLLSQVVREICGAGFSVALDDFGTKYTNLSILTDLQFNMLKIDKSLVHSVTERKDKQIVLKNVVHMCEELGIHVIAEGVETEEQAQTLRLLGCKNAQGYLYGKPMTVAEFEHTYFDL